MDNKIMAVIAYFLGIFSVIFLLIEKEDKFVRFHAAQSIVLAVVMYLSFAIVIGFLLSPLYFILGIFCMYKAYKGEEWEIPVLGGLARKLV